MLEQEPISPEVTPPGALPETQALPQISGNPGEISQDPSVNPPSPRRDLPGFNPNQVSLPLVPRPFQENN